MPSSAAACRWRWAWPWPTRCRGSSGSPAASSATAPWPRAIFTKRMNLAALWQLPGAVRLREQPLRHGHRPCAIPRPSPTWQQKGASYGMPGRERRRHGRAGRGGRGQAGGRVRAEAARPLFPGMPHLPLPRPFHVRRRALPDQGRGGGMEEARPDRRLSPAPAGAGAPGAGRTWSSWKRRWPAK